MNPVGEVKTDLKATYEQYFKDGEQSINTTIKRAALINPDVAIANGDVNVNFNVEPLKRALFSGLPSTSGKAGLGKSSC